MIRATPSEQELMKPKDYYCMLVPMALILTIDYWSKGLASYLVDTIKSFGPVNFHFVINRGMILGSFSNLPEGLRVIGLSTILGFLLFLFILINLLLAQKAYYFKWGLAIFFAGVTGNIVDRIRLGYVIDFIRWDYLFTSPTCNLADVFQWPGFGLTLYGIFREESSIWFKNNTRKRYLIDPQYQIPLALRWATFSFVACLTLGIYAYSYLRTAIIKSDPLHAKDILASFTLAYLGLACIIIVMFFITSLVMSNQSAGPIYAFERLVDDFLEGRFRSLTLRKGDHHQQLINLGEKIMASMVGEPPPLPPQDLGEEREEPKDDRREEEKN